MMFDDLNATQVELFGHVQAACQAIKFLRNAEPLECIRGATHRRAPRNHSRLWG